VGEDNTVYYGFPNDADYEVWNDWDIGFKFRSVQGNLLFFPSAGSVDAWSPNGHPDNQQHDNYCSKDTDYNERGVGGEGSQHTRPVSGQGASWHRFGVPGLQLACGDQLWPYGMNWVGPKKYHLRNSRVPEGSVIRFSTFAESGDRNNERWAFTPDFWVL
jgi:hypothetical protein